MPKKIYKKTEKELKEVGILPSLTEWNGKVNKSGDTITGKLTVQSGDASGCLQIGADVASNTLTAGTRKLARMTFPTREYGTTKTCSIMSCDNMNNYNYVEFGGHIGDATNTAPDYMCFNVDKTHNSLSPATKECVMAISPTSLRLFNGAVDAGQITSFDSISGKWVFNNANTFKNSDYTYTLPNKAGTVALKEDTPTKVSQLENDSKFTSNTGTITEIKVNGTSKGTSGSVNLTNMVTFASSQTATVAGTSKTTYTYNQPTGDSNTGSSNGSAYFPEGIIMGGTAASAGLVTRGICGVSTPNATTGACDKENLYINYDGNNTYQSSRQLVLQAGSVGTHYGNNLYEYAAARGDAVKNYCDATYAKKSSLSSKADLDSNGKVPSSQLPSYVDDVEEYTSKSSFPATGTTSKIYVDTTTNLTYRWSGTTYVEISPSLALGETSFTAYAGNKGAANANNINTILGYFDSDGKAKTAITAIAAIDDENGRKITATYVDKTVTSTESMAGSLSVAGSITSPYIATGTGDNNYFQSRKFRGEGNAATYYHAVDFGFAGHNQVDFYEYGGIWNFWKNTEAAATTDSNNLCLQIGDTYVKNKGNKFTWPTTGGTLALADDLPTQATSTKLGLVKSSTTGTAANRDYNVEVNSDGTMKVNVPWTYINTSHSHSAGVGLVGSGRAGASGTYTYKAKLRSETALTVDSAAATTSGNVYPVAVDKSGYLSLNVPLAGFEDILKGIKGRTQVEWNALNAGEYGSNSTYNGATLPPVLLENTSGFWNSSSGRPLDISFHFTKKEKITTLQVKCPPYSGVNPTMTVYYAQKGDAGLTLYKEIATISTADRKTYEFNEEGISADYWVVRFTSSGWIDLRLCSPSGLFTTGLYTEECHQQIMDRFNGYQPVGNYQPKGNYVTTNTAQTISGVKTFSDSIILPPKNAIMLGTGADGKIYDNSSFYDKKLDGIVLEDMTEADTDGYYCFRKDYHSNLTQYKTLTDFFGHARALHKGGMVDSNNTKFVGFGKASGYPWFGLTTYDRDYNHGALVESYGIMVRKGDVAGHSSAYIIDGGASTDKETRLVTEDEMAGKANVGHNHAISEITNLQSTLNGKVNSDDLLKITGSSGFGDANWHYRKIGHFIFNSSDSRNGAPVHLSGVIGDWAQGKMIFDIFVSTRGGLTVNGFVRGTNPSCRLVIDNTENPNIFLAVKGFATYNITVNTFENAKNENNAVRGSFHIDWTGGDDFSGSDVGVTATNFAYKDLLSRVAYQRAYYSYTGAFAETSGTATKLCEVSGGETGKIICVHGQATSTNSELSIQRRAMNYYDYDCIAIAPTGYNSGTYISCTGVVPPRLQYSATGDTPSESTYYIFGKNVSNVYIITFDLP